MTLRYILLAILGTALWGFNVPVSKAILQEIPSYMTMTIRFGIVSLFLPFFWRKPAPMRILLPTALCFSVGGLGFMFLSLEQNFPGSVFIIVDQINIPFLMLAGAVLFKEKITGWNIIGTIISIVGIYMLYKFPAGDYDFLGYLYTIISAAFYVAYCILVKHMKNANSFALIIWIAFLSLPFAAGISLLIEPHAVAQLKAHFGWPMLAGLCYMALGSSLIGHNIWAFLLTRANVSLLAPFTLLVPVFAVIGSIIFLNEPITKMMSLSMVLVIVGVAMSQYKTRRRKRLMVRAEET